MKLLNIKIKKSKKIKEINVEDIFLDSSNLPSHNTDNQEGSIEKIISGKPQRLILYFLLLIILIFLIRLIFLQIYKHDFYLSKADYNRYNFSIILANRGEIFDRNGKILARNILSHDKNSFNSIDIKNSTVSTSTNIKINSVQENNLKNNNILRREYISEHGLSNTLGYVSYPKIDNNGNFWRDKYEGKDGIELYYQDILSGINGKKILEKDVRNDLQSDNVVVNAVNGANLFLTIDSDLQKNFYESIKKVVDTKDFNSGAGVIMDVNNGEILSLVSYPEYDNNILTNQDSKEDSEKISNYLKDKRAPFLNRVVGGVFTPGSVVKPFMAYAALQEGVITPEKEILSTGALIIKNEYGGPDTVFRDWKIHGYVDVVKALAQSSDEYFYQVGGGFKNQTGLGISRIDLYANLFGLSTLTGIDLPREAKSVLPTPEWKRVNFLNGDWKVGDTYHTSIGQFGFQSTPISLVRYVASIANGGKLLKPHLFLSGSSSDINISNNIIKKYKDENTKFTDLNLDPKILSYIHEGMRQAVLPNGTIKNLNFPDLKIGAKSGTAELGSRKERINSLLIGYFPFNKPKYAFAIVMENGKVNTPGASEAASLFFEYFRKNKDKYLNTN